MKYNTVSGYDVLPVTTSLVVQAQINYPNQGNASNARSPLTLRAVTWPDGLRIDLLIAFPADVTTMVIKRSSVASPCTIVDGEVIYNGIPAEHFIDGKKVTETVGGVSGKQKPPLLEANVVSSGTALVAGFYYYTVFLTSAADPVGLQDFGFFALGGSQVSGLAIKDYASTDEFFLRLLPRYILDYDFAQAEATGRDTGIVHDMMRFVQSAISLFRGLNDGLQALNVPDATVPGLVGDPESQTAVLDAMVAGLGMEPPRSLLDAAVLRRLAADLIPFYALKGSCPGVVMFFKALTGWDVTCEEYGGGACTSTILKTWDGQQVKKVFSFPASVMTLSVGSLTAPMGLDPSAHAGSLLVTALGQVLTIDTNTDENITFVDPLATPVAEEPITILTAVLVVGTSYTLTVERAILPVDLNDGEYVGMYILDSSNKLMLVLGSIGGTLRVNSPSGVPALGDAVASSSFAVGATVADRDPQMVFAVFTGCPTFLYDQHYALNLMTTTYDPHDYLWSGGSLFGNAYSVGDVIITVSDVAVAVGTVSAVVGNTIYFSSPSLSPQTLLGFALNPNQNQNQLFTISANTSSSITVESPYPSVTLDQMTSEGCSFAVLSPADGRRHVEAVANLHRRCIPAGVKAFLVFS